jgi:hypothetical protein
MPMAKINGKRWAAAQVKLLSCHDWPKLPEYSFLNRS